MNDVVSRMISSQIILFLYTLSGVIVSKIGIITKDNRGVLVRLLMDVAVPMMILDAFNKPTTREEILSSVTVMAIAAGACVIAGLIGTLIWRKKPTNQKNVLLYATMFSNAGMAGLPVISLVFGDVGVFYASMYLIPPRIFQWTVGLSLFVKKEKGAWVKNVLLNPVVVVVYIGFVLMLTGWQLPETLGRAVSGIGDMTGPMSMILIGATLSNMKMKMLVDKSVLEISFLRLIVIPLIFAGILSLTNLDKTAVSICVILLAMPVASNTASISERYGGDSEFASACVSVSTLLSCATVPLITWAIQNMAY